jgi:hypothetical protein
VSFMEIRFLQPYFLVLLFAIPLLWLWPKRTTRRVHAALRSIVFTALVIALARPVLLTTDTRTYHVLVLDRSASVGPAARQQQDRAVRRLLDTIADKDTTSVILVGGGSPQSSEARSNTPTAAAEPLPGIATTIQIDDTESSSPLSAGLAAAARQIPEGSRGVISLFSDGLATDRRWAPAVARLIECGIATSIPST